MGTRGMCVCANMACIVCQKLSSAFMSFRIGVDTKDAGAAKTSVSSYSIRRNQATIRVPIDASQMQCHLAWAKRNQRQSSTWQMDEKAAAMRISNCQPTQLQLNGQLPTY